MKAFYALGFVVSPLLASIMASTLLFSPSNPLAIALLVILAVLSILCGRAWYRSKDNLGRGDLKRAVRTGILCFAIPLVVIAIGAGLSTSTVNGGLP